MPFGLPQQNNVKESVEALPPSTEEYDRGKISPAPSPKGHNPQGSAFPITVADMLKAPHKSPEASRAIEGELANLAQIDSFLAVSDSKSNFRRHALI